MDCSLAPNPRRVLLWLCVGASRHAGMSDTSWSRRKRWRRCAWGRSEKALTSGSWHQASATARLQERREERYVRSPPSVPLVLQGRWWTACWLMTKALGSSRVATSRFLSLYPSILRLGGSVCTCLWLNSDEPSPWQHPPGNFGKRQQNKGSRGVLPQQQGNNQY